MLTKMPPWNVAFLTAIGLVVVPAPAVVIVRMGALMGPVWLLSLHFTNMYYSPPAMLFGEPHLHVGKFGAYPATTTGYVLAAALYAVVGWLIGWAARVSWLHRHAEQ